MTDRVAAAKAHPHSRDAGRVAGIATSYGGVGVANKEAETTEMWSMRYEEALHEAAHGAVPQRGQPVEDLRPRQKLGPHAAAVGVAELPVLRPRCAVGIERGAVT